MSSRGLPAPGSKKLKTESKRVEKWKFQLFFNFFDSFSTRFLTFWTPGPEGPGNSFSTPFPTLGPKGPRTLGGRKGRNPKMPPKLSSLHKRGPLILFQNYHAATNDCHFNFWGIKQANLEDRDLLKFRSLDSSCPFFLSDNSLWGQ